MKTAKKIAKTPRDDRLGVGTAPHKKLEKCGALKTKTHRTEPCTDLYGPDTNLVARKNQVWIVGEVDIHTYTPRLLSCSTKEHAHIAY